MSENEKDISNRELISLVKSFRSGGDFSEIYKLFEKRINTYTYKMPYIAEREDLKSELTLFLIELLLRIELSRFKEDDSNKMQRYIAVSLKFQKTSLYREIYLRHGFFLSDTTVYEDKEVRLEHLFKTDAKIEEKVFFRDAMRKLTARQREVIINKYAYDVSISKTSKELNISATAANMHRNLAIKKLKEYYKGDKKKS